MSGTPTSGWLWSEGGQEFITYPEFPPPPPSGSISDVTFENISGFIPRSGATVFDFDTGTVRRPGVPNADMANSLSGLDSDYVESLDLYADVPVRVAVEDDQGQTAVGFWQDESRDFQFRDVRVKKLQVYTYNPANISVVASVEPELGFMTEGGPLDLQRQAVDSVGDITETSITLDDTPMLLSWVPEIVPIADIDNIILSREAVPIPANSTPTLWVRNNSVSTYDIAVSAEITNTKYPWYSNDWAPLPGWTESSPKVVAPDDEAYFTLTSGLDTSEFPGRYVRFQAWQNEQSGQTEEAEFSLNANA